jgi:hypothetical protein
MEKLIISSRDYDCDAPDQGRAMRASCEAPLLRGSPGFVRYCLVTDSTLLPVKTPLEAS